MDTQLPIPAARDHRSRALGIISFVIAVVALIMASVAAYLLIIARTGIPTIVSGWETMLGMRLAIAAIVVGTVSLTLAIIAIATRQSRIWGVLAMIACLLTWLLTVGAVLLGYFASL